MNIDTVIDGQNAVLTPHGSIDSSTSDILDAEIAKADPQGDMELRFDFSDVDYISSKCLRILVAAYRRNTSRLISVSNANPTVAEIFSISGLADLFNVNKA